MELTNDFRVSVAPAMAWKVFTDVERIAPLLPGAQLQEIEGDEYRGIVKVKVGPIQAQYKGVATFVEQDESAGRVVLKATGRDTRGQGNANATITAVMSPDGDGTRVSVVTDLTVTGKVAQFGRGVLADVSGKLIGQFVTALEADLEKGDSPVASAEETPGASGGDAAVPPLEAAGPVASGERLVGDDPEVEAPEPAAGATTGLEEVIAGGPVGPGTTAIPVSGTEPTTAGSVGGGPRRIDSPEPEPVDLLDAAGGSVAKRALPAGAVVVAVVVFVVLRRRANARRGGVAERLGSLPNAEELRQMGRKAAKQARKKGSKAAKKGSKAASKAANKAANKVANNAADQANKAGRRAGKASKKAGRQAAIRAALASSLVAQSTGRS